MQLQTLTAPVDGVVQQLAIHTLGGIVTPAQTLMVLVPAESPLEINLHAGLLPRQLRPSGCLLRFGFSPSIEHRQPPAELTQCRSGFLDSVKRTLKLIHGILAVVFASGLAGEQRSLRVPEVLDGHTYF